MEELEKGWITRQEWEEIQRKAHRVDTVRLSDGSTDWLYRVRVGDVWIGEVRSGG